LKKSDKSIVNKFPLAGNLIMNIGGIMEIFINTNYEVSDIETLLLKSLVQEKCDELYKVDVSGQYLLNEKEIIVKNIK